MTVKLNMGEIKFDNTINSDLGPLQKTTYESTFPSIWEAKNQPEITIHYLKPKKTTNLANLELPSILSNKESNFDLDGDGKLSEKEKAAAVAYHEKQAAEKVKKQFDFDNDGKLDEAEQAAYDAFMKAESTEKPGKTESKTSQISLENTNSQKTTDEKLNIEDSEKPENKPNTEPVKNNEMNKESNNPERQKLENELKKLETIVAQDKKRLAELEKELEDTSWIQFAKKNRIKKEIESLKRNISAGEQHIESLRQHLDKADSTANNT